jgi:prepilin-type N-terminal cleavage/methylation domain-containing protein
VQSVRSTFRRRAFTLIELLVVIAIIAILAAILFPVFSSAKVAAQKASALSQMRQLAIGLQLYLQDSDDTFMPSANYDAPIDHPSRIWTNPLLPYVKDRSVFVAPTASGSKFAESWGNRHEQSVGLNDITAYARLGLLPGRICASGEIRLGCSAFSSVANASQMEETSRTGMLAVTPHGPPGSRYRGFVFGADNGTHLRPDFTTFTDLKQAVPLASDRDLVPELPSWDPSLLKPIFARYGATGRDDGTTPIIFADCHAKSYRAQAIKTGASGIIWRFR